ncbi:hypothetical protein ACF1FX_34580 [Streptomyces sp. NPDC014646]|uniref:hypothetical protein n=1 Tax=Streptomyces sp. NPDC014646 TaxID=3364877 RepID=UPI0036FE5D42
MAVVLRAGLAEEIERQESEDEALGYEPEDCARVLAAVRRLWRGRAVREDDGPVVMTRTVLPARRERVLETGVPVLPAGYVAVDRRTQLGGDEIRARVLMVAAIARWGSQRYEGGRP